MFFGAKCGVYEGVCGSSVSEMLALARSEHCEWTRRARSVMNADTFDLRYMSAGYYYRWHTLSPALYSIVVR